MANKKRKTHAEKAASAATPKKKNKTTKQQKKTAEVKERIIPIRAISATIFLGLFVLFLVIFLVPEGVFIRLFESIFYGILGKVGFIVSIPVLLYLFVIHAFSAGRPVKMRSISLGIFVLCIGCIAHLRMNPQNLSGGVQVIVDLYNGGIANYTGGVLCGGIAMLLKWLCGPVIPYIILILGGILAVLGGMQITIPSIIRAIQERPRAEWENNTVEPRQEPASIVVNHIAKKRIEYIESHRQSEKEHDYAYPEEPAQDVFVVPATKKSPTEKAKDMIRQIDGDLDTPVAAASGVTSIFDDTEIIAAHNQSKVSGIPELEVEPKKKTRKVTAKEAEIAEKEVAEEIAKDEAEGKPEYCFPPIDLLKLSGGGVADGTAEMRENSRRLNETLASFKIDAHIINVTRGPSVTRYEVELEKGVKLNKLTSSADDIALSLGATGVRIAAVPGKISVVGIEVPNRAVNTVSLREVIDSPEFITAKSKSAFAVGKDIGGSCIVGNIARLPHMLIAGTTGSGKSVCMNSIIISLLYKASPDDVKLIMVDPKMVELGIYNGIPHLLIPVVTDPKKAAGSLQWAVTEMMRRYKAMSDAGVRDLESYNSIIESQEFDGKKMPQVVVIIDELADLMLVAAKEVEESICRIAQMGRAAGIHLVIATQRPSADVITGLMKANIPSRIAFAVASAMESRIILDTMGAEKLVGKGDMLFAPIGNGKPKRVQGCFVSDSEVESVANYVKNNYNTEYDQSVMEEIERKAVQTGNKQAAAEPEANSDELGGDEMLPAAVEVILETGQASVSMLQRRLKLGYARAARIVDEMEERGIVGPFQGSKPRTILVTKEQWAAMSAGQNAQMGFEDLEEDPEWEEVVEEE